jgi:hypothetical protein
MDLSLPGISRIGSGNRRSSRALQVSLRFPGTLDERPRALRLPTGVRSLRWVVSPVKLSAGQDREDRHQLSWRIEPSCLGASNRCTSPISAAKVRATRYEAPRIS